jgi:methylenetetrahydrofolate--tRNA-(uracil-5-)-methyltransferase
VTAAVEAHPRIDVTRRRQDDLDIDTPAVIATGPLTGDLLSASLQEHCSNEHLYFYDAIAPSIDGATLDADMGFWASRYDKGEADYFNIPLDRDEYVDLIGRIQRADIVDAHAFEDAKYFESCLPVEVIVSRGEDTLRHGPLKPRGLTDPRTGREPYACIQLRQESRDGTLMGLVGFQTRMKYPAQKEVLHSIRGLSGANILRYGSIHRNIFMNIPEICDRYLRDRRRAGLYYAGQICGVEGYVECIMSGIVVALSIYAESLGRELPAFPDETMIGSLMNYVHTPTKRFQPMNANMGILPVGDLRRIRRKRERYTAVAQRAIAAMDEYRSANAWLFDQAAASSA